MLVFRALRSQGLYAAHHIRGLRTTPCTSTFRVGSPPQSHWRVGDGAAPPPSHVSDKIKTTEVKDAVPRDLYQILGSAIVPRPIAFVSTLSTDGVPNLAPFSYFSMIGHNPPMVSISCSLTTRRPKDTRENILATRQFSVNIVSEHLAVPMNATSVECPADVDEWEIAGLKKRSSVGIKPALVDASLVNFECELYHHLDIAPPSETGQDNVPPTTTLILGLIQRVHVNEGILTPDGNAIDPAKLQAVARLGGTSYAKVNEGFELARPVWKEMRSQMEAKRVQD